MQESLETAERKGNQAEGRERQAGNCQPTSRRTAKLDFNLILAGLVVNDSDTIVKKTVRVGEGTLKGLYAIPVNTNYGKAYICNGSEFPTPATVEVLLFLLYLAEQQNWRRDIYFSSIREFLRSMGKKEDGRTMEQLKRSLVILANHSYYFDNSFYDAESGKKKTLYFGVVDDFKWNDDGNGVVVRLNEELVKILSSTKWYRRVPIDEFFSLKGETAKALFLYLINFHREGREWEVYLPEDLVVWYRNLTNSKATTLKVSRVKHLIEKAVKEINAKTSLSCKIENWKKITVTTSSLLVEDESVSPSPPPCPVVEETVSSPLSFQEDEDSTPREEKKELTVEEKRAVLNKELSEEERKELILYLKNRWAKLNTMGVKISWNKLKYNFLKEHSLEEIKRLARELTEKRKGQTQVQKPKTEVKAEQPKEQEEVSDELSFLMKHLRKGKPILKSIVSRGKAVLERKGKTILVKVEDTLTRRAVESLIAPYVDGVEIRVVEN